MGKLLLPGMSPSGGPEAKARFTADLGPRLNAGPIFLAVPGQNYPEIVHLGAQRAS